MEKAVPALPYAPDSDKLNVRKEAVSSIWQGFFID
jgi:hypothetical protein